MKSKECIPIIIKLQDDELIMSWIEMLAEVNGIALKEFLVNFLGYQYGKTKDYVNDFRKDQLMNLESICNRHESQWFPDVEEILKKHTGYYACLPFRKKETNAMFSENILRKKDEKKILVNRLFDQEVENYMICPDCIKEDMEKGNRKYVRVWHNLPGVTCCAKHGCKLIQKGNDHEYAMAAEEELKAALFMYQLYQKSIYGCSEWTISLLKDYGLIFPKNKSYILTKGAYLVAKIFTYEIFVEKMKDFTEYPKDIEKLFMERKCKICGTVYRISIDAENMGFGCPNCDSKEEYHKLVERFVERSNNGEFRLIELLPRGRVQVEHVPCGRNYRKNFFDMIRNDGSCPKCSNDHTGEIITKTNGEKMTIINYRNSNDIDVQFEDGMIAKHRTYDSFKKGITRYPFGESRLGETVMSTKGQKVTIIGYRNVNDIDVQFEDGTIVKNRSYYSFVNGNIKHPDIPLMLDCRVGETSIANSGEKMTIIRYGSALDIDVQFEDGGIARNKEYRKFQNGSIKNPNKSVAWGRRVGETGLSKKGQKMTIIEYRNHNDIDIQFEDGSIVTKKKYCRFLDGSIKNPNCKIKRKKKDKEKN